MKAVFNRSVIMRNAHERYRNRVIYANGYSETFSDCLLASWATSKAYVMSGKSSFYFGVSFIAPKDDEFEEFDYIAADYSHDVDEYGQKRYFGD